MAPLVTWSGPTTACSCARNHWTHWGSNGAQLTRHRAHDMHQFRPARLVHLHSHPPTLLVSLVSLTPAPGWREPAALCQRCSNTNTVRGLTASLTAVNCTTTGVRVAWLMFISWEHNAGASQLDQQWNSIAGLLLLARAQLGLAGV